MYQLMIDSYLIASLGLFIIVTLFSCIILFKILLIIIYTADCYNSDGECYQTQHTFIQNCSQCVYPDNNCIIQCDPVMCPSLPNDCDTMVPTSDGCCMTCEGTANIM